jgi:ABC-type uncharacterized transport system substrate-binding protein
MNNATHRLLGWLLLAGALTLGPGAAQAHPHVWIVASSKVIYAPDGSISGVRHAWTFDDIFSTYSVQGIETKTKGVYSREELEPLARLNVESLKEFRFFTFAKADEARVKFKEPVDYYLEYKDAALTLHFTLPLETPVKPKQLSLQVYDPVFFIDFSFADKDPAGLVGAPAACRMTFLRPYERDPNAPKLGDPNFTIDASEADAKTANRITVDCP